MQTSISVNSILGLFTAMVVLSFVPGVSVLAVSARSAASGFIQGVFTTLGIVLGDAVYIVLAIYGLSIIADLMGSHFFLVKYLGGVYLLGLGVKHWISVTHEHRLDKNRESSLLSSFLTGLLITLSDQKAIFFYLGFFPAFIDLSSATFADTVIIVTVATVAVGGVKLVYAFVAATTGSILNSASAKKAINMSAGSILVCVGVFLLATA
ncbi:MAG: LysE family translocator [Gammaproteobacteria bacterium]